MYGPCRCWKASSKAPHSWGLMMEAHSQTRRVGYPWRCHLTVHAVRCHLIIHWVRADSPWLMLLQCCCTFEPIWAQWGCGVVWAQWGCRVAWVQCSCRIVQVQCGCRIVQVQWSCRIAWVQQGCRIAVVVVGGRGNCATCTKTARPSSLGHAMLRGTMDRQHFGTAGHVVW